ncbi:MAG: phytanoyl-CoA dioxygenase family protein [Gammaproteobacteria bacterium]|nr:phytanoyl-CoA dioxygenase family protein [Gammaproteobacteria bacterium]MCH9744483.1 phytanoyl-CoA dioxygenase family protein [Gammaproteobacteria bacterium]
MFSDEDKRNYNEYGYLIKESFFCKELLNDFSMELADCIAYFLSKAGIMQPYPSGEVIYDDGIMLLKDKGHEYVAMLYDTIFQMPSFFRICGNIKLQQLINFLMSRDLDSALYGFTNRCRIDSPRDERRTYGWHQEVFYTIPESNFIQTWAPLVRDTTRMNGTIWVCPGSHREGIPAQTWTEEEGRADQIIINDSTIKKYNPIQVELELGDLLVFSGKTIHRSGENNSKNVRYSLVGMYHDVSSKNFRPPKIEFQHRTMSPRKYYKMLMAESIQVV